MTMRREGPVLVDGNGYTLYLPPPTGLEGLQKSIPDPYESSVEQRWPLGTRMEYGLQTFRYCRMGAVAGAPGKLYQSVVPLAGHLDEVITFPAIGAVTIDFTPAVATTDDLAKDELADGFIHTNGTEGGLGQMYRIKSHPAITGAVAGTLTLWDAIRVAPVSPQTATVYHNPYRSVIVHPSPPTAHLVGVAPRAIPASEYAWLQTKGPCPVLTQGTVVIQRGVMPSATVDGAVADYTFTLNEAAPNTVDGTQSRVMVGVVMAVLADADYSLIWLNLE